MAISTAGVMAKNTEWFHQPFLTVKGNLQNEKKKKKAFPDIQLTEIVSGIYKELTNVKKTNNLIKNWDMKLNRKFLKEET